MEMVKVKFGTYSRAGKKYDDVREVPEHIAEKELAKPKRSAQRKANEVYRSRGWESAELVTKSKTKSE